MKNTLNYYYNLYPTSIHQINESYKCYVENEEYLLTPCYDNLKLINEIYNLSNYLSQINVPCHKIIKNIKGQVLTLINNINYILMKIVVQNNMITTGDILYFSLIYIEPKYLNELKRNDWNHMWSKKIDYFEYQVSQFGLRYPVIRESINYYLGMAENCISLFSYLNINYYPQLSVGHNRIKIREGYLELYNPLNFIIDNRVRDLSEYIKDKFFFAKYTKEEAEADISKFSFNNIEYSLLFVRLLYPSYYFDCYEEVLRGIKDEKELLKIISKSKSYIIFLKNLYNFIKPISNMPDIEWIMKT